MEFGCQPRKYANILKSDIKLSVVLIKVLMHKILI